MRNISNGFENLTSEEFATHVLDVVGDTPEVRERLGLQELNHDPDSLVSPANRAFNAWLASGHQ